MTFAAVMVPSPVARRKAEHREDPLALPPPPPPA
jgi:hypothetical protein